MVSIADTKSCLFLAEWEEVRKESHLARRHHAEMTLCDLQHRVRNGMSSMGAWLAVVDSRRKLEEMASSAAARALEELEARWRPQRLEASDGEAAAWLLASERAHAAALAARGSLWATVVPPGAGAELRRCQQALCDTLTGSIAASARSWDEAHAAATQAWLAHDERLQAAARAMEEDRTPPDAWLSEVRYRERARAHLLSQAATEASLASAAETLASLEAQRAAFWEAFVVAYGQAAAIDGSIVVGAPSTEDQPRLVPVPEVAQSSSATFLAPVALPQAPPVRPEASAAAAAAAAAVAPATQAHRLGELPDMPTASGAVLLRTRSAWMAPAGFFGRGGGWREGAVLVLTLHGYLHIFAGMKADAGDKSSGGQASGHEVQGADAGQADVEEEPLVEAAIKASVYLPMAPRCVFLRKGKELTLDVSEAEGSGPPVATASGGVDESVNASGANSGCGDGGGGHGGASRGGLRQWLSGGGSGPQPPARRVQARLFDEATFSDLERRCHEFVRKGQARRKAQ